MRHTKRKMTEEMPQWLRSANMRGMLRTRKVRVLEEEHGHQRRYAWHHVTVMMLTEANT